MTRPELPAWLSAHWSSIEDQARGFDADLSHTLRPTIVGSGGRALRAAPAEERLRLEETLGSGGMGVVRRGTQTALVRSVAVKSLRSGRRDPRDVAKLLQEGWVAARLEHPNIVPVYDIDLGDDGRPRIIMRRIEGRSWRELLREADAVRESFGAEDLLEWNLRILMQVANAVHFAHSRRIVHLDLKPSNVMIGAFGEVYLVDWGLAMSLDPDEEHLPRAVENTEIIGTAAYVAPEMLTSDGSWLEERTDVYLLGSCLFEVLAGHPPHRGSNHVAVFFNAATKDPEIPEDAPAELAELLRRCLSREPEGRPATAEAVRLGIQDFLQHRGSSRLAEEATAALEQLDGTDPSDSRRIHGLATEARFGFREALAAWPENEAAQAGFRRATIHLARGALGVGDINTAFALSQELAEPDATLSGEIEAALDAARKAEARLAQLQAESEQMNPRTGQRTRVFLAGLMGLVWTVAPLLSESLRSSNQVNEWAWMFALPVLFLLMAGGLGVWARESMLKTRYNRQAGALVLLVLVAQLAMTGVGWLLEVDLIHLRVLFMVLWSTASAAAAILLEPRSWIFSAGYALAALVSARWPDLTFWAMSGSSAVFFATVVITWWPDHVRGPVGMDPLED